MWAGVSLSLMNLQPDVGCGFKSSEGLPGAGQPAAEMVHSLSWLLGAGCWQGIRWNSLLVGCLNIQPYNMAAGFSPEWVIQEEAKQKWEWYFWRSLKVIVHHFCRILWVVQICPDRLWQKTTQAWWGKDTRGHVACCLSSYNTYTFFLSAKKKDGIVVYMPTYQPCD